MTFPSNYLEGRFEEDRLELERVRACIRDVSRTFVRVVVDCQWPYDLKDGRSIEVPPIERYSQSTNAMILFALLAAARKVASRCPLVPDLSLFGDVELSNSLKGFAKVWAKLIDKTNENITEYRFGGEPGEAHVCWSGSFGWDDPFTLTWLLEIDRAGQFDPMPEDVRTAIRSRAATQVDRVFKVPWQGSADAGTGSFWLQWQPDPAIGKEKLQKLEEARQIRPDNFSVDHAFPALRYVHLCRSLQLLPEGSTGKNDWVYSYMESRAHEQLSKSEIRDGNFDASELVFALEGLLLLSPDSVTRAFMERVFNVIRESQNRSPYWRPIKPFVATPQGQVLFPLSVETATSLLRSCTLTEEHHQLRCFSDNADLFRRYSEWLLSKLKRGKVQAISGDEIEFAGWHSEHVHLHPGIHPWETSMAMLFLVDYNSMLERHVARSSLTAANLKETHPWAKGQKSWHMQYWDREREIGEPLDGLDENSPLRIYKHARDYFIVPRPSPRVLDASANNGTEKSNASAIQYSMLLYGPPGTGKTSFAEELSRALRWPLIIVTPSDFIRGGESEVEARAKMIFEVLESQSDAVVLFDEIDRMILDRDSQLYGNQSDIFQFMTPSMLTKLRDLRQRKRVIFLIATNYAERIDAAAKRRGRLDTQALLAPPDIKARVTILKGFIGKRIGTDVERRAFEDRACQMLESVAKTTRLYVYGELKGICESAFQRLTPEDRDDPKKIVAEVESVVRNAEPPAISLTSYRSRFTTVEVEQRPFAEFLLLLYLLLEDGGVLTEEQRSLADDVLKRVAKVDAWNRRNRKKKRDLVQEHLQTLLLNDNKVADVILDDLERT